MRDSIAAVVPQRRLRKTPFVRGVVASIFMVLVSLFVLPSVARAEVQCKENDYSCLIDPTPDLSKAGPVLGFVNNIVEYVVIYGILAGAVIAVVLIAIGITVAIRKDAPKRLKEVLQGLLIALVGVGVLAGGGMIWLLNTTGSVVGGFFS